MIRQELKICVGDVVVEGDLIVPVGAVGIVLFAHGSGSSRFSTRNQFVAKEFNRAKIKTLSQLNTASTSACLQSA
jgi:hypothetical protein